MSTDIRDAIIQQHAPTIMAPTVGELAPLARPGHRYIAARDGLYLQVLRPWLSLTQPIAPAIAGRLPYGEVKPQICVEFGKMPRELLQRFLAEARKSVPHEHAAWILWNNQTRALEYFNLDVQAFSTDYVRYNRPQLPDHLSLAIDLHSHGAMGAFFSATDDEDDAGEVKIAGVLGNLRAGGTAEWRFRLCALGLVKDLPAPKDL